MALGATADVGPRAPPRSVQGRVDQASTMPHGVELYDICVYGAHRGCGP